MTLSHSPLSFNGMNAKRSDMKHMVLDDIHIRTPYKRPSECELEEEDLLVQLETTNISTS
jgi:hypothetical protein